MRERQGRWPETAQAPGLKTAYVSRLSVMEHKPMSPAEELAQLKHLLLGMVQAFSGDVMRLSENGRPKMLAAYSMTLTEWLADFDKLHESYAKFLREQVAAEVAKAKAPTPQGAKK
jgi:hypothetical protein